MDIDGNEGIDLNGGVFNANVLASHFTGLNQSIDIAILMAPLPIQKNSFPPAFVFPTNSLWSMLWFLFFFLLKNFLRCFVLWTQWMERLMACSISWIKKQRKIKDETIGATGKVGVHGVVCPTPQWTALPASSSFTYFRGSKSYLIEGKWLIKWRNDEMPAHSRSLSQFC